MSTETNANGAAPIAAPNATAQPPAAQPPAPQPDVDKEPERDPAWLGKRLERERKKAVSEAEAEARKKALAELGIDDPDRVKKLLAEEKKREEAQKSQEQKLAELQVREKERESRLKELEDTVKLDASEQLAALTEEQRKAVLDLAGEDPAKQRRAIATLRPTWAKPAEAKPQESVAGSSQGSPSQNQAPTAAPAVPAKPATPTAPAPNAPSPAGSTVTENHLETYRALSTPGTPRYAPFVAAAYRVAHWSEINAAQKARGG
jgi:hypothetical protein